MITAIQNFISKKGKFVFILLLLLVIFSFVLYLSQGSSVFDLLPDPNKESRDFYGYDWNDPDQRRYLTVTNRVAADFGVVSPPTGKAFNDADESFMQNLQGQLQQAFRANQQDVDQQALQRLFGFMQAWPNFPRDLKVREIARSGSYSPEFSEATVQAKVSLDAQANSWSFLPLEVNHPSINQKFTEYVSQIDPNLLDEANRSRALEFVGRRHGLSPREVESVLFSHFRTSLVNDVFALNGYALKEEANLDLHSDSFAWDGEVYEVRSDQSSAKLPVLFNLKFKELPKEGTRIDFSFANQNTTFICANNLKENNNSEVLVQLGDKLPAFIQNFQRKIELENFGIRVSKTGRDGLSLTVKAGGKSRSYPKISSTSSSLVVRDLLKEKLRAFFEERKGEDPFAKAPRTFASAILFSSAPHFLEPSQPDEARMRSYFDRNRLDFLPSAESTEQKGVPGPVGAADANSTGDANEEELLAELSKDANSSSSPAVTFEEVKEEVAKRILQLDREEAKREAERLSREDALTFLESLNQLGDRLRSKYGDFPKIRNSSELDELISQSGAKERKISFNADEMNVQAMVLGLEARESERRSNREPLEEVSQLNERIYFTRSVRKTRDGYAVFLLNRKVGKEDGEFESTQFNKLYDQYIEFLNRAEFEAMCSKVLSDLNENSPQSISKSSLFAVSAKNSLTSRNSFDARQRKLGAQIEKLENTKTELAAQENNSTQSRPKELAQIDSTLQGLRDAQAELVRERELISRLLQAAPTLAVNEEWSELERTEERALFVKLSQVYTLRKLESSTDEVLGRERDLELARSEKDRDSLVDDLIQAKLAD
jgi:hypothetical protein